MLELSRSKRDNSTPSVSSQQQSKKYTWLKRWKDIRFSLLFTITLLLISGRQAQANPPVVNGPTAPGGGCLGWLCGPKNTITRTFPGNTTVVDAGFVLMQAVILAILAGIAAITINKIASREDYGAPMAAFFGALLVLLVTNYLAGYVFGIQ